MISGLAACLAITQLGQSSLNALQSEFRSSSEKPAKLMEINSAVFQLIEDGKLQNAADFSAAASIISYASNDYTIARVQHELTLAALADGDEASASRVAFTWDALLITMGREQRIGTMVYAPLASIGQKFHLDQAPKSIWLVFKNPVKAREAASAAKTDVEITKICDEDQAARQRDWAKLTAVEMNAIGQEDHKRLLRIVSLLKQGRVRTAEDFDHASLVMQHGTVWADYVMAHELSICSLLLGRKEAAWLAAATYDRMLLSSGLAQRFGTQAGSINGLPFKMSRIDTAAINDFERKALHAPSLKEASDRKWGLQ